ncbi:urease accessory protein UreD [Paenibacillus dendritiformis]|uniref:urease accessory protein UreD n=1 Tax=Paenibacillus dendritiformis TaxID=130049 RepID=UPI00143D3545|nr:urease accessory protein UreD [Paenibacillus dendritiformis]NKI22090.1 urease accessory protein UreD [Paenibacillus dendritiformis]NRF98721.1 urease accessory protein UreD [Paenibacillus dendritiformis]GIO73494.1 urease accessory protein UreD [Paenibacillus dendritiformis]
MVPWTGQLELKVEQRGGRSAASRQYHQGAYKIARPIYPDESGQVHYYVMNPGGGYVGGDRYRMELELGEGASALLTTQSSTKIYRTPEVPVFQLTRIALEAGSYLEWLPDSVIGYRGSRYRQQTDIRMDRSAALILGEIVTPGWSPDGEHFSYDEIALKTMIEMGGVPVLSDHLRLRPGDQAIRGLGRMDGHTHVGSLFVIGPLATRAFIEEMAETLELNRQEGCIGLSELIIPGFGVRMLGDSTQAIETLFGRIANMVRKRWFGWGPISLRKY